MLDVSVVVEDAEAEGVEVEGVKNREDASAWTGDFGPAVALAFAEVPEDPNNDVEDEVVSSSSSSPKRELLKADLVANNEPEG